MMKLSCRGPGLALFGSLSRASQQKQINKIIQPLNSILAQRVKHPAGISSVGLNLLQVKGKRLFSSSSIAFNVRQKVEHGGKKTVSVALTYLFKTFIYTSLVVGLVFSVIATLLLAFFIYDATTYSPDRLDVVKVPELALNPVRGGPKNLPICYTHLDSHDSEEKELCSKKPKLVILGSGWGSVSLLKSIDPESYDITVISPRNYFLFTPMLTSATVGTLEFRSLMEPIRRICSKVGAHFLEGSAMNVEFSDRLVEVSTVINEQTGERRSYYVPYDKLVVGIGSTTNTHGVSGLKYCHFLKSVQDARFIRNTIISNLELACLPTTSLEERKRLLSFVVCGGGPTGVELAAEIFDLLNEDITKQYPKVIRNLVSVHIIQSRSHILNTYDEKISEYAMERFKKDSINVLVNARVEEVLEGKVLFSQTDDDNNVYHKELPYGMCVWSTGVTQAPITKRITQELGSDHRGQAVAGIGVGRGHDRGDGFAPRRLENHRRCRGARTARNHRQIWHFLHGAIGAGAG